MDIHDQSTLPIADWIDWTDVPIIMAIARTGSLSRAATRLGVSQPTLSRRLEACETKIGVPLFLRSPRGVAPTSFGRTLVTYAEHANSSILSAQAALVAPQAEPSGKVSVTASEWLCQAVLPSMMAALTRAYPQLHIQLVADASLHNLPRGDSDIALRPIRFSQNTVYQTAIATVSFGLYASPSYLAEHGTPSCASTFTGHRILHLVARGRTVVADTVWLRRLARGADVVATCNGRLMLAECARAHQGIVCLPRYLGERYGDLRLIQTEQEPPSRKLWLGTSKSARRFDRVKVVRDYLCEKFREIADELNR